MIHLLLSMFNFSQAFVNKFEKVLWLDMSDLLEIKTEEASALD